MKPFLQPYSLDMYVDSDLATISATHAFDRKRKRDYRNMTLIPEFTEKKQRLLRSRP